MLSLVRMASVDRRPVQEAGKRSELGQGVTGGRGRARREAGRLQPELVGIAVGSVLDRETRLPGYYRYCLQ